MIVCKIMAIVVTCALPYQMDLGVAVLLIIPWIPTAGTVVVSLFVCYYIQCLWLPGACNPFQYRKGRDITSPFQRFEIQGQIMEFYTHYCDMN